MRPLEVRGQKLDGERGKRIVAGVINALVLGIPLADNDIVLERRARETMEVHAVNVDNVGRFPEGLADVSVFENAIPDFVGAGFLVQNAFILQRLFAVVRCQHEVPGGLKHVPRNVADEHFIVSKKNYAFLRIC